MPLAALLPVFALAGADRLDRAYRRGDLEELARLGAQTGPTALAPLIRDGNRAAIHAAPASDEAWSLLDELAVVAGGWDRQLAVPAARSAAMIARRLDAELPDRAEIGDDELASIAETWTAIAQRSDRWADVRVLGLETAARVGELRVPPVGFDAVGMLADPDAELRRAAAELVAEPLAPAVAATLAQLVVSDDDPHVLLAAAQTLCAQTPPQPIPNPGLERLRHALFEPPLEASTGALLGAARCLAASGTTDDDLAIRALAAKVRAIRAPLLRLVK